MNVLLAIDGSAESIAAAEFFVRLPLPSKPNIHALTVLQDFTNTEIPIVDPEIEECEAREHFDCVRDVLKTVGYDATHLIKRDHPSRAILDAAKETDADLIVLGARGHSVIYRIILGSTADYVANHAACSVLVVRPHAVHPPDSGQFRVMLAYDGSPYAKIASRKMFSLLWSAATDRIHIAMMLERPKLIPDEVQYDPDAIKEAEQTLPTLRQPSACSCEISYTVRETTHVGGALLDLATHKNISLLFIGPTGKSALSRFFMGSTSRYLLHHSSCSVWIARD